MPWHFCNGSLSPITKMRIPKKTKKALIYKAFSLVGLVGLEPMTPTMSTWCSNQLSYNPTGHNVKIIA